MELSNLTGTLLDWTLLCWSWILLVLYVHRLKGSDVFIFNFEHISHLFLVFLLKLEIKRPESRHWRRYVFIFDFEHISHLFLLLTFNRWILAGYSVDLGKLTRLYNSPLFSLIPQMTTNKCDERQTLTADHQLLFGVLLQTDLQNIFKLT